MVDRLKPMTPAWHARQRRWQHNSFHGHVAMMRANCNSIMQSSTASDAAKRYANQIHSLTYDLAEELKTRKPGT